MFILFEFAAREVSFFACEVETLAVSLRAFRDNALWIWQPCAGSAVRAAAAKREVCVCELCVALWGFCGRFQ